MRARQEPPRDCRRPHTVPQLGVRLDGTLQGGRYRRHPGIFQGLAGPQGRTIQDKSHPLKDGQQDDTQEAWRGHTQKDQNHIPHNIGDEDNAEAGHVCQDAAASPRKQGRH